METTAAKKIRIFRGEENILNILTAFKQSGLSIKSFCDENSISLATFHNWKRKYISGRAKPGRQPGFTSLRIVPSSPAPETALFAEVNGIKIYQRVDAAYLKALQA